MKGRTLSRAIHSRRPRTAAATSSTTTRGEIATNLGAAPSTAGRRKGGGGRAAVASPVAAPVSAPVDGVGAGRAGSSIVRQTTRRGPPSRARTRGDPRAASAMAAHARARTGCPPARGSRAERGVGGRARRRGTAVGARDRRTSEGPGRVRGAPGGRDGGRGRADGRDPVRSMAGLARSGGADGRDAPGLVDDGPRGRVARRTRAGGRGVRRGLPDRAWRGGGRAALGGGRPNGVLGAASLFRTRDKGGSSVRYDLRPLLESIEVVQGSPVALRVRTRFDPQLGNGRPEEVVAALAEEVGRGPRHRRHRS